MKHKIGSKTIGYEKATHNEYNIISPYLTTQTEKAVKIRELDACKVIIHRIDEIMAGMSKARNEFVKRRNLILRESCVEDELFKEDK